MEKQEVRCIVSGKVQGVMYRGFIARRARGLALTGYVRNIPDSKVEIVAQGYPDALEKLLSHTRRGPFMARVSHIEVEERQPQETFDTFEVVF